MKYLTLLFTLAFAATSQAQTCDLACVTTYEQGKQANFKMIENQAKQIAAQTAQIAALKKAFGLNLRGGTSFELYNELDQLRDNKTTLEAQATELIGVRDDLELLNNQLGIDLAACNTALNDTQVSLNTVVAERNAALAQCSSGESPGVSPQVAVQIAEIHHWATVKEQELLNEIFRLVQDKDLIRTERDICWAGDQCPAANQ